MGTINNSSHSLENGSGSEPSAAAHRYQRQGGIPALELVQRCRDEPAPRGPDRVAQGDGAAVDVHLVPVDAMSLLPGAHHGGECLIDLEEVDVPDGHAR